MNSSNILKINSDLPVNSGSFHFFIKIPLRMQKKYLTTLDKAVHTVYLIIDKGFAVFSKKGVTAGCCHRYDGRS